MLKLKKLEAIIETLLLLTAVIVMIVICFPFCALLSLAGMVLRMFKVEFVSRLAGKAMTMMIIFVKFVTARIKARTNELEELREKYSAAN